MNVKTGIALIFIIMGALILLGKLGIGFGFGGVVSYLIPFALVGLGYYGIKHGRSFFGWLFMIIGMITLISKFSWIIGIVIAVCLIGYGFKLLSRQTNAY